MRQSGMRRSSSKIVEENGTLPKGTKAMDVAKVAWYGCKVVQLTRGDDVMERNG